MITIMKGLLERFLRQLVGQACHFEAGEMVFHIDDAVHSIHLIETGTIHLVRYQRDGAALILQRAKPGSILAEASLYSDVYHCDAGAAIPTRTCAIDKAKLRARLVLDKDFQEAWSRHLASELQASRSQVELLSLKTVSERLDAWVAANGGTLPGKGSWKSIASEIGVSEEALYREFARRRRLSINR
ncbi:MAG: Crp/Fnr family transcriptional regulator [Beijerinckiaceae bacterium]|nr:Crp/Fnr family transcriptional regulator [Beijerinckiaceae bacterium]